MIHDREEATRWKKRFPLRPGKLPSYWDVHQIVTPKQFSHYRQIADEIVADARDLPTAVPTDICLWNYGEAPRREMTKIGGLPYMPRDLEWPTFEGRPLAFLGQFCFADSADLFDDLPAPILLMFGQPPGDYPGYTEFEWVDLGQEDLIEPIDVPGDALQFKPCYASLFRSADYPTSRPLPSKPALGPHSETYPLFYHGTKIGGVCTLPEPDYGELPEGEEPPPKSSPGLFLGQLASLEGIAPSPWPFVNLRKGDWGDSSDGGFVSFTGNGTLFLHLDEQGIVRDSLFFT